MGKLKRQVAVTTDDPRPLELRVGPLIDLWAFGVADDFTAWSTAMSRHGNAHAAWCRANGWPTTWHEIKNHPARGWLRDTRGPWSLSDTDDAAERLADAGAPARWSPSSTASQRALRALQRDLDLPAD